MFTEEEVKTAKATRDEIIRDNIEVLKGIYMAGEICMWDEIRENPLHKYGIKAPILHSLPKQSETFGEYVKRTLDGNIIPTPLLWEDVIQDCEQFAYDGMNIRNRVEQLMSKFIISKR